MLADAISLSRSFMISMIQKVVRCQFLFHCVFFFLLAKRTAAFLGLVVVLSLISFAVPFSDLGLTPAFFLVAA